MTGHERLSNLAFCCQFIAPAESLGSYKNASWKQAACWKESDAARCRMAHSNARAHGCSKKARCVSPPTAHGSLSERSKGSRVLASTSAGRRRFAYIAPSVRAHVIDSFEGKRGMLTARVLGFVPVARSRGPATDKGEAMRGRPSFLGDRSLSAKRRAFAGKQWLQTNCGPLSMMGGPGQRSSSRSMPRDTCLAALRPVVRGWS